MATYAVGDIQGCHNELRALLDSAHFDPHKDCLWAVGDLVNRGPDSLATLRFIKNLPHQQVVLGNHDLHLLAAANGHKNLSPKDTLNDIMQADDRDELLHWLQQQPLIHRDKALGFTMVHAGIPPIWSLDDAIQYASEVQQVLRSSQANTFFSQMYGNLPDNWTEELSGTERLRVITNYLTRMRFCEASGRLDLATKTAPNTAPEGYSPWFAHKQHKCANDKILFGHWASLQSNTGVENFIALDTGCVWGGVLTMLRLQDKRKFSLACDCELKISPK